MVAFLKKYREALRLKHGWQVELQCSQCGHCGVPAYDGWTPSRAITLGNSPLIYANVSCSECGKDLKQEGGEKLVELFSGIAVPGRNKVLIAWFVACMAGISLILVACIHLGIRAGFWGRQAFAGLPLMAIAIGPAIMYFNYKVASIRMTCDCGSPDYILMGLLGRSYCHRCSSCGRLLRMRD